MSLRRSPTTWSLFGGTRSVQSQLIDFTLPELAPARIEQLAGQLAELGCLPEGFAEVSAETPALRLVKLACAVHQALLAEAHLFMPEETEVLPDEGASTAIRVAVPRIPMLGNMASTSLRHIVGCCLQSVNGKKPATQWVAETRKQLADGERTMANNHHFARAARELGMPFLEWQGQAFQIGFGKAAVAMRGAMTQDTAAIGVHIARQKQACNGVLAQAGFPIAMGGLVSNLTHARGQAERLGFPVVVKPADLDGGVAVSSDIRTMEELERGFKSARAKSPNVIVEKHVDGLDYRLLIFGEQLLVALERSPGGITGDGKRGVRALLDEFNADPRRTKDQNTLLYPIDLDDEAMVMLERQGLTLESVPEEGQFVALRRAANFALGGSVRRVDDIVHPDNLELARRALRTLRLDLAGVDMILPDITRPWHETGGAICEINAQPFVGEPVTEDHYRLILSRLIEGEGRVPIVLVVGDLDQPARGKIAAEVPDLAIVDSSCARLNGQPISVPGSAWPLSCQAPLFNTGVGAMLCILDDVTHAGAGSPVDRFSSAFILSDDEVPPAVQALLKRAGSVALAAGVKDEELEKAGISTRRITGKSIADELLKALK
ncbi:hypothetical protein [Alteraurantiacibacter aquimixticola]|uniref:ATP-grasp domain-containing protein n=1 Tax=Alteraurantiacibacter aquimixticola TaxID=2489173 RepID=A0A4T3F805_9SPHN|nr:hypothetical protein [Alteraurantiacibacter aquimixticola]TIX51140.1 hypothetical protein E5222_01275 [Alteraurantiacibacter aquimixticola]